MDENEVRVRDLVCFTADSMDLGWHKRINSIESANGVDNHGAQIILRDA